jgi:uncharacterized protein YndB with AHSA1/START domain
MIHDASTLEVSVRIDAPPDIVFPYFTDPQRYVLWMGSEAVIEAEPGGIYRVRMRDGVETVGSFVEVEPPHRVVFTWGWAGDPVVAPGSTRVEITLTPVGESSTEVRLRHSGLPGRVETEHHEQGWLAYLTRLGVVVAGGDPGPDPNT